MTMTNPYASGQPSFNDLFMAQNLGIGGQQQSMAGMPSANAAPPTSTQPMSGPQNVPMPSDIQHIGDVINQYTQSQQSQQNNNGLVQQILSQRMQPTTQDVSQAGYNTSQSFLMPHLFQPQTPDQAMAQRYQMQLAPYTQGVALAGENAKLSGQLMQNNITAQTGLPMAQALLQKEQMTNDIMAKTGMSKAQAEIALQTAQAKQAGAEAGFYSSALQRDLAEKAYTYENDPQMAQARAMSAFLTSMNGGPPQGGSPPSSQSAFPTGGMSLPSTSGPTSINGTSLPQVQQQNAQTQPSAIGFNPMGAMLAKSMGLTDMQIARGPNGQPIAMPIPGAIKIENGSVITIGPDGKPTNAIPTNPIARGTIENNINLLSGKLDELKKAGGAVDEGQTYATNMENKILSNPWMQSLQAGNKSQTIRSEMASYIMQTMPDYMQAKGLTPGMERTVQGQEMILQAVGVDPGASVQANKAALANLSRIAGTGDYAKQMEQPSQSSDPLSQARDAISQGADRNAVMQRLQQNGIDATGL